MSGHTREWDRFNEKSPIRKETLTSNMAVLNAHLINDIEDAGQGALSAAKCFLKKLSNLMFPVFSCGLILKAS